MIKTSIRDIKVIGYYLGKIILDFGFIVFLPVIIGIIFKEKEPIWDFLLASGLCFVLGALLTIFLKSEREINWRQGLPLVCLVWLVAMFLSALPLYLSKHYASYLDACFEAMSGLATTGLTLTLDLDHLSFTHNFFRHLLMFVGGQGIIVVALSFLMRGAPGIFKMYVGEAREEKIFPNVISTARFIWLVSLVYLILGSTALAIIGVCEGMKLSNALFNSICIFMAGFDTGGFTPYSQNIGYYHSIFYELATLNIMFLGTLNFKLHYAVLSGNRKEIFKNIETVTFFITLMFTFFIVMLGLRQNKIYSSAIVYLRTGFYQLVSAHTGTGFSNIYSLQLIKEWPVMAWLGLIIAMGLGGAVCSTTGGIKTLRIGIIFKSICQDIRKILIPESAVSVGKFHHLQEIILDSKHVYSAFMITLFYILIYFFGALVAVGLGYPFLESLFESVSATANVGLSCGITQVGMPAILKVTYILQMWAGRLEFIAVFALIGFFIALLKEK